MLPEDCQKIKIAIQLLIFFTSAAHVPLHCHRDNKMSTIRCTQLFFSSLSCDQLVLSIMSIFKKEYFRVLEGPEIVISVWILNLEFTPRHSQVVMTQKKEEIFKKFQANIKTGLFVRFNLLQYSLK